MQPTEPEDFSRGDDSSTSSEASSLAGVRVVVTRAAHQGEELGNLLRVAGARVARLPLLEIIPPADPRPLERAASELAFYEWIAFTSVNAVEAFLPCAGGSFPPRLRVAAVGPATARALRAEDLPVHLEAPRGNAASLVEALAPFVGRRERVLLPQAADARPTLARGLTAAGAEAVVVVAYDKALPAAAAEQAKALFATEPLGWVTFTSPRIVRHFLEVLLAVLRAACGERWQARLAELRAASIGPVTSGALRGAGIQPAAEARSPTAAGLVEAILRAQPTSPG